MFKSIFKALGKRVGVDEKVKGSAGFEFVLLAPLMLATFLMLLYFFLMSMAYIQYNNLANIMAQNLNVRSTGYSKGIDGTLSYDVSGGNLDEVGITADGESVSLADYSANLTDGANVKTVVKVFTPGNSNNTLKRELNLIIRENASSIAMMPGAAVTDVIAKVTKGDKTVQVDPDMGIDLAGSTIKVQIEYSFLGLKMFGRGYNVIT